MMLDKKPLKKNKYKTNKLNEEFYSPPFVPTNRDVYKNMKKSIKKAELSGKDNLKQKIFED
jgi:hypothetical protein